MKKQFKRIFDMHVDPLVQAAIFSYDVSEKHDLTWKPRWGDNKVLWGFLRGFIYALEHNPLFNHSDIPRMLKANYGGAGFGIVAPSFSDTIDREIPDYLAHGIRHDEDIPKEILQNSIVYNENHEFNQRLLNDERGGKLGIKVSKQLELFNSLVSNPKSDAYFLREPEQFDDPENERKLGIFPTLEGAHCLEKLYAEKHRGQVLGKSQYIEYLKKICAEYELRYITLHHFCHNKVGWCSLKPLSGISEKHQVDKGLTELGKIFVAELHRLGVIVDVAHTCNLGIIDARTVQVEEGFSEQLGFEIPIIASHAVSRTAYDELAEASPTTYRELLWRYRGLKDESIIAIAETGGVIGVSVCPKHLKGSNTAAVDEWAYHCHRICDIIEDNVAGVDPKKFLAMGTDFDGWIPSLPRTITDCQDIGRLIEVLNSRKFKRKFSENDFAGLCSGNFMAAWKKVRKAEKILKQEKTGSK
jgi:microsomal dipeptidase-like Zn-dependent dipeptidase